ncbi:MAG TPA: J domain-containing protein [Chthoniobacter sp.]
MARLEQARAEWKRFEREDKPAFARWMAKTFGPLLTRVREIADLIRQKESLVEEVEMEMAMGGARSARSAFTQVQKRRDHFSAAPPGNSGEAPPPPEDSADDPLFPEDDPEEVSEFELELMFEELLGVMGWDPSRMSDKQYTKMFAEFKERVLGQKPPEPPSKLLPDSTPAKDEQSRIKELYRLLVRRLHPDTQADRDSEVSMLWHEVQEAYHDGNLDRLEMLLALTDIQSNTAGEQTSLFQMRAVLEELRDAFKALQRNLGAARKERAWGFARLANRSALETRIRCELETDLFRHEDRLQQLEALITQWSKPPKPRKRSSKTASADFPF